jgi:hypothetical protein
MGAPSKRAVTAAKTILAAQADTKAINCPEHPGKHSATLYCFPHRYAGTWECPMGFEDAHEHENLEVEDTEVDTMRNGEHDTYAAQIYVCADCGVTVEGDPAADRADDEMDREQD